MIKQLLAAVWRPIWYLTTTGGCGTLKDGSFHPVQKSAGSHCCSGRQDASWHFWLLCLRPLKGVSGLWASMLIFEKAACVAGRRWKGHRYFVFLLSSKYKAWWCKSSFTNFTFHFSWTMKLSLIILQSSNNADINKTYSNVALFIFEFSPSESRSPVRWSLGLGSDVLWCLRALIIPWV